YGEPSIVIHDSVSVSYGLVPWSTRENLASSKVVANPGCYATSVLMALIPLLKNDLIASEKLVIDAKSGISGAGRTLANKNLFCEVYGDFYPYRPGEHQHLPEIKRFTQIFSGKIVDPFFSTSILPVSRGLSSAIYAHTQYSEGQVIECFRETYKNYPLV